MSDKRFVQKSAAANLKIGHEGPARDFYFLLLPKSTMLAVSAAIEPLRIANQVTNTELFRWYTLSQDGNPVTCSNGVKITPDKGLDALPGNASIFVCAGVEPQAAASEATLNWLRRQRRGGSPVGGICTGSFALAQAGLLRDRTFTLHWDNQPSFNELFYDLSPTASLYEIDGPIMTCGGGAAATDMMLAMIQEVYGRELAVIVSDMCIHMRSATHSAPQKSALSVAIGSRNPRLLSAIDLMSAHIEDPLSVVEICDELQISRRHLERLFNRYTGETPVRYYYDLRVSRAHALLSETNLSVTEIAMATGFNNTNHLSLQFRRKFGVSPQAFRKGWSAPAAKDTL